MASPLYDLYDPDGELRRRAMLEALRSGNPAYRESLSDLLPEEERQGMLSRLANATTSGISGLGWILNTPGSVIRGGLSGGLGKAVSALWESSDDRVDGRELLRQYDMVGDEDTWGNWLAGFAAEVLLDPLTYMNPAAILGRGAYTTAGKALSRANALEDVALLARKQGKGVREYLRKSKADDILTQYQSEFGRDLRPEFADAAEALGSDAASLLGQRAAGTMEFRLPFAQTGTDISLTGGVAGDAVARFLDATGEAAKRTPGIAPLVNRTTRFFDTSVMGASDPDIQWRNREAFAKARNAQRDVREMYGILQARAEAADTSSLLQGFPEDLRSFNSQRIQNSLADYAEANGDISKLIDQEAARAISMVPEWAEVRQAFANQIGQAVTDAKARGVKLRKFDGASGFFPSQKRWFETESLPDIPGGRLAKQEKRYTAGQRALNLEDNLGRSRDPAYDLPMRRQSLRQLMGGDAGRDLQQRLLNASDPDAVQILEQAWQALDTANPGKFGRMYGGAEDAIAKTQQRIADTVAKAQQQGLNVRQQNALTKRLRRNLKKQQESLAGYKVKLVDQLRMADTQFADTGLGLFDNSAFDDMLRYDLGRARVNANADAVIDNLATLATKGSASSLVGGGGITLTEAASRLGFVPKQFKSAMLKRHNIDADAMLVTERQIQDLQQLMPQTPPASDGPLSRLYRSFTNAFKIGALANPAYHVRNLYSGQYATMSQGFADPVQILQNAYAGYKAGGGDTKQLLAQIRNIPRYKRVAESYRQLNPGAAEDAVDKAMLTQFQGDFARNRLGQGQVVGDVEGAAAAPGLYLGAGRSDVPLVGKDGLLWDNDRKARDLFTVRGVDFAGAFSDRRAPQRTLNPLLALHERTAARVEDANRMGAYLSALQRGSSPDDAARLVYQSQIDYSPEAFTAGEQALKRLVPFYSYPRGITPLIVDNLLYRPGGLQGQTIRAINAGNRSDDDYFVPDYLRQEAAIPIPWHPEGSELQRVIHNIDLPFVGVVNKFSGGTGNTMFQRVLDSVQRTGVNLAGDLNPIPKTLIEGLFGTQLYSGREFSDLYSTLEQSLGPDGRYLEQALINLVPGGSKALPIYRTIVDERLSPLERAGKIAINQLSGFKAGDINVKQAQQRAARDALQQLLENTSGADVYENINVPAEELAKMGPREQQMYLLYRVLQSDASKRARERRAAEQDPMQLLGVR